MSEKGLKTFIVPIFIPNQGCPHRCVFCEQRRISSQTGKPVTGLQVERILKGAIHSRKFSLNGNREVAFYGGTFTGLPVERMRELLGTVQPYIKDNLFNSIRISTRPDCLDKDRLDLLKSQGVATVELGAQSMDDRVLELSQRGHSAYDTTRAVYALRERGFKVGIQLMPGLPGDSTETFRRTVEKIIAQRPDMVRLYPALVIRGTGLAELYERGQYRPLGLVEAIDLCAEACMELEKQDIPVIRVGLMSSPTLLHRGQIKAGPWHQSFGHLVRSEIYHRTIQDRLQGPYCPLHGSQIKLRVRNKDVPLLTGYRQEGIKRIENKTGVQVCKVKGDDSLAEGELGIDRL